MNVFSAITAVAFIGAVGYTAWWAKEPQALWVLVLVIPLIKIMVDHK